MVKDPTNWQETDELAIAKRDRGAELRTTENKSIQWPGGRLQPAF